MCVPGLVLDQLSLVHLERFRLIGRVLGCSCDWSGGVCGWCFPFDDEAGPSYVPVGAHAHGRVVMVGCWVFDVIGLLVIMAVVFCGVAVLVVVLLYCVLLRPLIFFTCRGGIIYAETSMKQIHRTYRWLTTSLGSPYFFNKVLDQKLNAAGIKWFCLIIKCIHTWIFNFSILLFRSWCGHLALLKTVWYILKRWKFINELSCMTLPSFHAINSSDHKRVWKQD